MPSLATVVDLLHDWYPPDTADSFDAVGLVVGDPEAAVAKVTELTGELELALEA